MFGGSNERVQPVQPLRIACGEGLGQEVGLFLVIATRGRSSALDLGAHRGRVEQRLIGELFMPVIRSSSVSATTKSAPCLLRLMVVRVTR